MIRCPNGAIIRREELADLERALDMSVTWQSALIDSETPARRFRTEEDRKLLSERQRELAIYRKLHRQVKKINAAHARERRPKAEASCA